MQIFLVFKNNECFSDAMGYILHKPIYSSENLPSFPAAIKDGYAIKYNNNDTWSQKCHVFKVVQISVAGTDVNIC